jgi:hypothetical protein
MSDADSGTPEATGPRGWRFNFSKVRNFRVLPKSVPLDESSSDNDVPAITSPSTRPIRPPKILASPALTTSSISSPAKRQPLGETTIESLQLESEAIALQEASEHCAQLKRERDHLTLELRRLKVEHHSALTDFRGRVEKTGAKLERTAGILRSQVREETKRLATGRSSHEVEARFIQAREYEQRIKRTLQSFTSAHESISALANVLQYSPLAESDFTVIASTGSFDSPVGSAVAEFIEAAKKVAVRSLS